MNNTEPLQGIARRGFLRAMIGCAGAASMPFAASAQQDLDVPVVIELFTSQGCSSCPAADRLLSGLARKLNVFALSFSVDYWDYIGWKDTFASPAFTARQKAYAAARGDGHVYTPQAIIDGLHHAVGSDVSAIRAAATRLHGKKGAMKVAMRSKAGKDGVLCEIGEAVAGGADRAGLWLYRVWGERQVEIGRGENRGRKVTYVNIVRSVEKIGDWTGKAGRFEIAASTLQKDGAEGWVLMLQSGSPSRPGAILAAAKAEGF